MYLGTKNGDLITIVFNHTRVTVPRQSAIKNSELIRQLAAAASGNITISIENYMGVGTELDSNEIIRATILLLTAPNKIYRPGQIANELMVVANKLKTKLPIVHISRPLTYYSAPYRFHCTFSENDCTPATKLPTGAVYVKITGTWINGLTDLSQLKELHVANVPEIPASAELPRSIVVLDLINSAWGDGFGIEALDSLQSFREWKAVGVPSDIVFPKNLRVLSLGNSACGDVNWGELAHLRVFNGTENKNLPASIQFPASLEVLHLGGASCGDVNWSELIRLREFNGFGNKNLPAHIEFSPAIEVIDIGASSCGSINWADLPRLKKFWGRRNLNLPAYIKFPPSVEFINLVQSTCLEINENELTQLREIDLGH